MQTGLNTLLLITSLFLLSACDQFNASNPSDSASAVKDTHAVHKNGQFTRIGIIGGKTMGIPDNVYIVGWVHYNINEASNSDFTNPTEPPEKADSHPPINGFGFDMRITDGAVRTMDETANSLYPDDNAKFIPKGESYPWAHINVTAIKASSADQQNKNSLLSASLKSTGNYHYQLQQQPLNGLRYYRANNGIDPDTGKPWGKFFGRDILVNRNAQDDAMTVIKCDVGGSIKDCYQNFNIPELGISIRLRYNRHYLPQWQKMENNVRTILNSWVMSPEQTSQQ